MACIDLPAFPLQLLLRREPSLRDAPAAVVEAEKPQARLLWVNERARAGGVLPGMRCAAALSLLRALRVGAVSPREVARGIAEVTDLLRRFSPSVEAAPEEPGLFFASVAGLERLFRSPRAWADAVRGRLRGASLLARVVVGFRRFPCRALAKAGGRPETIVLATPEEEAARARAVALDRLRLDPAARDVLRELEVRTVRDLAELPASGLCARFGESAHALCREAQLDPSLPVQADPEETSAAERLLLDAPEHDAERLALFVERLLARLLAALRARRRAVAELLLGWRSEEGGGGRERLRPAEATLDLRQLGTLVRLRLPQVRPARGVVELEVDAVTVPLRPAQRELFAERPRRDPAAAAGAFARLRAEFGEGAVVKARLLDGHLPEARFEWAPLPELPRPETRATGERTLVRRLFLPPRPLAGAALVTLAGPFVLSGGWWRAARRREYRFAESGTGEWLWVFREGEEKSWSVEGRVE